MNLEKAVKNRLNHYKILKTKLESVQTKSALISLRNQFIQDQKRMNYQTEYDRLRRIKQVKLTGGDGGEIKG